jgi:integral membrane protein
MLLLNFAIKINTMSKIFKFVAISEGISYLVLLANMLFIKPSNFDLYKTLLFPIGMCHGVLFIGYVILAILIKKEQNWSIKDFAFVQLASFIPFGTFYVEKKYLKNA